MSATIPTWQELIDETRQLLYSGATDEVNVLAGDVGVSSTSVTLTYDLGGAARRGAILAMGQERMLVQAYDTVNKVVTVMRGYLTPQGSLGSNTYTHTAGDLVLVNPRFDDIAIGRAINDELIDLSSPSNGLYQVLSQDLTWSPVTEGYDLVGPSLIIGGTFLSVYEMSYKMQGPSKNWPRITRYETRTHLSTAGLGGDVLSIMIYEPAFPGNPIHVLYKTGFNTMTDLTNSDTNTVGLARTMIDIPPLGAAARLMTATEARRNQFQSQGDTRRAEEVPPGAAARSGSALLAMRQSRIDAERARLDLQYPLRRAM